MNKKIVFIVACGAFVQGAFPVVTYTIKNQTNWEAIPVITTGEWDQPQRVKGSGCGDMWNGIQGGASCKLVIPDTPDQKKITVSLNGPADANGRAQGSSATLRSPLPNTDTTLVILPHRDANGFFTIVIE